MGRAKRGGLAMKRLREERKAERRRSKAWKTRDRQRKADADALADVLGRLQQLANFIPGGRRC